MESERSVAGVPAYAGLNAGCRKLTTWKPQSHLHGSVAATWKDRQYCFAISKTMMLCLDCASDMRVLFSTSAASLATISALANHQEPRVPC